MTADVIKASTVAEVVGLRDAAMVAAGEGAELLARGFARLLEAEALADRARDGHVFHERDHAAQASYKVLFPRGFDPAQSVEAFRRHLDASTWLRLLTVSGLRSLMDRTAVEQLHAELATTVPPVSEDNVRATLFGMADDAPTIFRRGLARVFIELDRRFRSHDGFKLGSRIVLTRLFDEHGYWNVHGRGREAIHDVERVFAVLDGQRSNYEALVYAIDESRQGYGPRQGRCEGTYFRINTFKNGNAHLWFTRDDLVERANLELAAYYGEVLPDGVPASGPEADLASSSRALSRDLAFYPTPADVAERLVREANVHEHDTVLEPSAGVGDLARAILARGASVVAVEVDEDRHARLSALRGRIETVRANFLQLPQRPVYSKVVMNPPFYGVHWIAHVVHAFGFLAPGGELVAVVPATAETGTSRQHEEFRAWALERAERRWCLFQDLPLDSFVASGTRVNTSILHLRRRR